MTEEKQHARLSPSGAERWTTCFASIQLESDYPDTSSDYADWGTAAHSVSEMCLMSGSDAAAYKGRRIDIRPGKTIEVDQEMTECVQTYIDNIRARIAMYEAAGALSVDMHVELSVPIDHLTGEKGATGTADCVLVATFIDRITVDVNDLKGGRGVAVDAKDNKQLLMYAHGAMRLLALENTTDEVVLVIHQPRVRETPSEHSYPYEQFLELVNGCIAVPAKRAVLYLDSTTPLTLSDFAVTDKGCRFCKAKAACPAVQNAVQETIGADFEDLTEETASVIKDGLASAKIEVCMNAVDLIEDWCKAVRAEVERRLFQGVPVPGYKLVQGRQGSRKWSDEAQAEQTLKTMRLKQEEMYDFKLISPTTAEKLAKGGAIGPRQWPKLEALVTRAPGQPSVAPESDTRGALVIQPPSAEDFEVLDDTESLV